MMSKYSYIVILLVLLLASCANRGKGPQGGPRDTIPPVVLEESPLNGMLLFKEKEIVVHFDEYIQLDDVQNNVMISPPQQNAPEVKAVGKRLTVVFQEDLQDSTTYTIDFGAGNYGIRNASKYYFNKEPSELTLEEATLIVGIPRNPSYYNPITNYEAAKERQKEIDLAYTELGYSLEKAKENAYNLLIIS